MGSSESSVPRILAHKKVIKARSFTRVRLISWYLGRSCATTWSKSIDETCVQSSLRCRYAVVVSAKEKNFCVTFLFDILEQRVFFSFFFLIFFLVTSSELVEESGVYTYTYSMYARINNEFDGATIPIVYSRVHDGYNYIYVYIYICIYIYI